METVLLHNFLVNYYDFRSVGCIPTIHVSTETNPTDLLTEIIIERSKTIL